MWVDDYVAQIRENLATEQKTLDIITDGGIDWDSPYTLHQTLVKFLDDITKTGVSRHDVQRLKSLEKVGNIFIGLDENNFTSDRTYSGVLEVRRLIEKALSVSE